MSTVTPAIRKARPNSDGSFGVKIAIGAKSKTAYINTRYKIDNLSQWKNGRVIRRDDANTINMKLHDLVCRIQELIDESSAAPDMSASELKSFVERNLNRTDEFVEFGERYIAELTENNQTSYAKNMGYTVRAVSDCFGEHVQLGSFSPSYIDQFERHLRKHGQSDTTINIRMSHLKALINAAITEGVVEYKIFPFRGYRMPTKNVRDICISKPELERLRTAEFSGVSAKRLTVARDLFMLSFYCAGINLTDLMDATFDSGVLTFIRKKTATKKKGTDIKVSITIQPEAKEIIDKYVNEQGRLEMGYNYADYGQFRSFVTKSLNRIGEELGFEKKLMFYSARKTFVQFGSEIGIPLYILEYAIGQTIKEANNRPIFNYLRVMRQQADLAVRTIIDYTLEENSEEEAIPLPEWARRRR